MEYQSFGRHQRPKGANMKQALQVMLLLAVCAWLVYQVKHSRNKTQNYGGQTKLLVGYGAMSLGRKGTPSLLDERSLPDSGNVDSAEEPQESSSGRDAVLDGAVEDKAEEKFGYINEKFRTNEAREVELEPERQPKVSPKYKYNDCYKENSGKVNIEPRRSEADDKEQSNEKYSKVPVISDPRSNEKKTEVKHRELPNDVHVKKNAKSGVSLKENVAKSVTDAGMTERIDGVHSFQDENGVPPDSNETFREKETETGGNVVKSTTNAGMTERTDAVHSFQDENGVPPAGNETEFVVGKAYILHEEEISDFSKGGKFAKSNIHEVTSGEDNDDR